MKKNIIFAITDCRTIFNHRVSTIFGEKMNSFPVVSRNWVPTQIVTLDPMRKIVTSRGQSTKLILSCDSDSEAKFNYKYQKHS